MLSQRRDRHKKVITLLDKQSYLVNKSIPFAVFCMTRALILVI